MDFKNFDFRSLQKYLGPQSSHDLNLFLERLPQRAGQTVLIAAGIAWGTAAAVGLFTMVQLQQLTELRAELAETQSLTPIVPRIKDAPINKAEVEEFLKKTEDSYEGLRFVQNGSTVNITATRTSDFAQFREAMGHIQNGGNGWRVSLDKLCVGRECDRQQKLAASLKINKVSVEKAN